jgi:hypothetical protein
MIKSFVDPTTAPPSVGAQKAPFRPQALLHTYFDGGRKYPETAPFPELCYLSLVPLTP